MQKLKENAKYQQQQQSRAANADALADDCNKVMSGAHWGCNIQEDTNDEMTTQTGCWGLPASAPDFCLTKYR